MSTAALIGGVGLIMCAGSSAVTLFLMTNQSTNESGSSGESSGLDSSDGLDSSGGSGSSGESPPPPPPPPAPAPAPALPPPPPSPSSYFTASCQDLGGGSDIINASSKDDCLNLCRTNAHGYPYTCKGVIYGANYDGRSPFCRIYNNKDLGGGNICPSGIKSYVLK